MVSIQSFSLQEHGLSSNFVALYSHRTYQNTSMQVLLLLKQDCGVHNTSPGKVAECSIFTAHQATKRPPTS